MVVDCLVLVAILLGEPECDALALALAGAEVPVICAPNWLEATMVISQETELKATVFMRLPATG